VTKCQEAQSCQPSKTSEGAVPLARIGRMTFDSIASLVPEIVLLYETKNVARARRAGLRNRLTIARREAEGVDAACAGRRAPRVRRSVSQSVGCSQNSPTSGNAAWNDEHPQVKEGNARTCTAELLTDRAGAVAEAFVVIGPDDGTLPTPKLARPSSRAAPMEPSQRVSSIRGVHRCLDFRRGHLPPVRREQR
jgi:hypothetical protein